jgi:hypothetical protein
MLVAFDQLFHDGSDALKKLCFTTSLLHGSSRSYAAI